MLIVMQDMTPALFSAVGQGMHRAVQKAIGAGADVNAQNERGHSALHFACDRGQLAVVKVLVESGANLSKREGRDQTTPVFIATLNKR